MPGLKLIPINKRGPRNPHNLEDHFYIEMELSRLYNIAGQHKKSLKFMFLSFKHA